VSLTAEPSPILSWFSLSYVLSLSTKTVGLHSLVPLSDQSSLGLSMSLEPIGDGSSTSVRSSQESVFSSLLSLSKRLSLQSFSQRKPRESERKLDRIATSPLWSSPLSTQSISLPKLLESLSSCLLKSSSFSV